MQIFRRLRLTFCFFGREVSTLTAFTLPDRPSFYSLPCRNQIIPIKNILDQIAGFARSRRPVEATHYCLPDPIYLWWRWRESNSRPEHISINFKRSFNYLWLFDNNIFVIIGFTYIDNLTLTCSFSSTYIL